MIYFTKILPIQIRSNCMVCWVGLEKRDYKGQKCRTRLVGRLNIKMAQNDQKWSKMTKSDQKWPNGPNRPKWPNGQK